MAQNDNDGNFEDDRDSDYLETGRGAPGKRKKASSGGTNWVKIILILLGVGAVSLALCCGIGGYFASKAFKMELDPVKITAMQKEIVEIDIPPGLQPKMGMNMNLGVMTMKMVMYNPESGTSMMLMQMQVTGQTEEQMQQAFNQQAGQQQQQKQFQLESREIKTITVDGQERKFNFDKGTLSPQGRPATPVRMITGMFPAKTGTGFIQYTIDEDKYDEAAVIKTIERRGGASLSPRSGGRGGVGERAAG